MFAHGLSRRRCGLLRRSLRGLLRRCFRDFLRGWSVRANLAVADLRTLGDRENERRALACLGVIAVFRAAPNDRNGGFVAEQRFSLDVGFVLSSRRCSTTFRARCRPVGCCRDRSTGSALGWLAGGRSRPACRGPSRRLAWRFWLRLAIDHCCSGFQRTHEPRFGVLLAAW